MKTGILLSGGIDSIALAFWKRPDWAVTVDYGQKPAATEIRTAKQICSELGISHEVLSVDCSSLGSGDLAGSSPLKGSPSPEWWPFRNQLLVTIASMRAIQLEVQALLLGAVKSDSFHVDGTEVFFQAIDQLMFMQEGGIRISTPAINLTSEELVKISGIPISLLAWAHSCHVSEVACGNCRGCYKHQSIMDKLGYGYY